MKMSIPASVPIRVELPEHSEELEGETQPQGRTEEPRLEVMPSKSSM